MQNVILRQDEKGKDREVVIYNEYSDCSGFVIREIIETKNEAMRFQVGRHVMKPMRLPVYKYITECVNGEDVKKAILTHHKDGDDIQKFELLGNGRTKEEALQRASNKLLRREVEKRNNP
jgi:hypothetical protein